MTGEDALRDLLAELRVERYRKVPPPLPQRPTKEYARERLRVLVETDRREESA